MIFQKGNPFSMDFVSNVFNPIVNATLDGIITYINDQYPTDWDRYIEIVPSSVAHSHMRNGATSLVNRSMQDGPYDASQSWCSENESLPNVILRFKSFYISPTYYSFQTRDFDDFYYPKSWFVQGSIDRINWINISNELSSSQLNRNEIKTFSFEKFGVFKYLKIIQTADLSSENHFCLQQIEVFGELLKQFPSKYIRNITFKEYIIIHALFLIF